MIGTGLLATGLHSLSCWSGKGYTHFLGDEETSLGFKCYILLYFSSLLIEIDW